MPVFPNKTEDEFAVCQCAKAYVADSHVGPIRLRRWRSFVITITLIRGLRKVKYMQLILVTQEKSEPLARSNVKLPDVCKSVGVPRINKYELFRRLNAKYVLDATHEFDEVYAG